MNAVVMQESVVIDDTDRAVIRAIQLAPRGSFSAIGQVLGLSEQTVARRYRKLQRCGVMRVVAAVSPEALGQHSWMVRVQCRPDASVAIADALARRDDVSWVVLAAGGSEVVCAVLSRSREQREDLLLRRLPRTAQVLGVQAAVLLHMFIGGRSDDWAGFRSALTASQSAELSALSQAQADGDGDAERGGPVRLEPGDERLIDVLRRSGRASYAELASAGGISEGRAARRLAALLRSGIVYLDIDLSAPLLGFHGRANLWLSVAPAHLHAAGQALRNCPEVAHAAAISGPHNLTVAVTCRDLEHLYEFATTGVGGLPGVQALEISPVLRQVKQSGAILSGDRLVDAPAAIGPPRRRGPAASPVR